MGRATLVRIAILVSERTGLPSAVPSLLLTGGSWPAASSTSELWRDPPPQRHSARSQSTCNVEIPSLLVDEAVAPAQRSFAGIPNDPYSGKPNLAAVGVSG